jgi:hypothetical protein
MLQSLHNCDRSRGERAALLSTGGLWCNVSSLPSFSLSPATFTLRYSPAAVPKRKLTQEELKELLAKRREEKALKEKEEAKARELKRRTEGAWAGRDWQADPTVIDSTGSVQISIRLSLPNVPHVASIKPPHLFCCCCRRCLLQARPRWRWRMRLPRCSASSRRSR